MNNGLISSGWLEIILFALLVVVRAIRPRTTDLTSFELQRRVASGDVGAKTILKRRRYLPLVLSLRSVIETVLSVLLTVFAVLWLGVILGALLSITLLLLSSWVAQVSFISRWSQKLYNKYENQITTFARKLGWVLQVISSSDNSRKQFSFHSKEELLHLIHEAKTTLNENERNLLTHAMKFEERTVKDVMTPRGAVETIGKSEVLGPVVLDRLHKTGHKRFPVINKDFNHVIGLLWTSELVVGSKKLNNASAEKMMQPHVFYMNENESLKNALAAFLRMQAYLFIVINEAQETTGIITIEDVVKTLLGRKPTTEFDQYENRGLVASNSNDS